MRKFLVITMAFVTLAGSAQTTPAPCAAGDPHCLPAAATPPRRDLKKARQEFELARTLQQQGKFAEAFQAINQAVELAPLVSEYVSAREVIRQQLVSLHISTGNQLLSSKKNVEAIAEFRQALAVDPNNEYAKQRLRDATSQPAHAASAPVTQPPALTAVEESKPILLSPASGFKDFHLKGPSRTILQQIADAFGTKVIFDDSVTSKPIRFDMEGVDFFTAFREACTLAHVFWVPLTPKQAILFNDTQQLRREFERMVSYTFYVSDASSAQDLTDIVNLLRTLFDVRFAVPQSANNSIVVRAPAATVEASVKLLNDFLVRKPQVTVNVKVFEVTHSFMKQMGITLQDQFQVINVDVAALALLGQTNIQTLINQLIASGGINSTNSTALQTLLSQLQNQQSSNSTLGQLLSTPFASFGGGKTFFAVPLSGVSATFQANKSDVRSLEDITLRTSQGNAATMKIGTRYPILNASFAPVFNTPAIASVIANGSYAQPFPSFTYEDLGITMKATPQVLADNTISLKLEMQIRSLTGTSLNGVPVISNRDYSGSMCVLDGSPTAVIGMLTKSEQKSLSGLPGLGQLLGPHSLDDESDELLIVVTPTIISPAHRTLGGTEIWVPTS